MRLPPFLIAATIALLSAACTTQAGEDVELN